VIQDLVDQAYLAKIQELQLLSDELEVKKKRCLDELGHLDEDTERRATERKSLMCTCEALTSKLALET
jgi:hypothetical protein